MNFQLARNINNYHGAASAEPYHDTTKDFLYVYSLAPFITPHSRLSVYIQLHSIPPTWVIRQVMRMDYTTYQYYTYNDDTDDNRSGVFLATSGELALVLNYQFPVRL